MSHKTVPKEQMFPLPGFEQVELLDRDRHGELYKACVSGGEQWAVVRLFTELTPPMHARFRAFLPVFDRIGAVLKDPHFARVHDMGDLGGYSYAVGDFISGYTVGEWCARKGRLKASDALRVAEYAVAAMKLLHERAGVVHGNLRASDLLVAERGEVRLRCFSTSAAIMAGSGGPYLPDYANPYLAPELERGTRRPSVQSDMYMLGMLLMHLVTGEAPVPPAGEAGSAATRVFQRRGRIPAELLGMLRRLTAQDPDARYEDWGQVAADVVLAQAGVLTAETETRRRPASAAVVAAPASRAGAPRRGPPLWVWFVFGLAALLSMVAWVIHQLDVASDGYGIPIILTGRTNRPPFRVQSQRMEVVTPVPVGGIAGGMRESTEMEETSAIDNAGELIDNSDNVRR